MKKTWTFLLWLSSICTPLISGNEIPNPSFEEGPNCKPDDISQMDGVNGCNDWENFNTSDWLTDKVGNPCLNLRPLFNGNYDLSGLSNGDENVANLPILDAYHGDYFAGFGPCEGIQVKLKHEVGGINKMVRISFWYSPRTREDTKIIVYLLQSQASDFSDCTNPGISTEVSFEVEINSSGADAIHHPGSWYYFEKVIFPCPGDPIYEYFAIKGENLNPGPSECCYFSRRYIYVDDFNLEEEDFCNHPCAIFNGGCFMNPSANDPDFPNATSGIPQNGAYWAVELHNILGYKFTVFDGGWDGVYDGDPGIYYIQEFDPNGLSWNGGPWVVSWTGENSYGNCVPVGIYPIVLEFWNCENHVTVTNKFIAYLGDGCSVLTPIETPCFNEAECNQRVCDPSLFLTTSPVQSLYQATNTIDARLQFQVVPLERVDLSAGDEIILGDGFEAQEGSEFRARIAPCEVNAQRSMSPDTMILSALDANSVDPRRSLNHSLKVVSDSIYKGANLISTGIFILSSRSEETLVNIYDNAGRLIKISSSYVVDLSEFTDGTYFYQVVSDGCITRSGRLIKIE